MKLRSSDELPDDVGTVFITNAHDVPFQVLGRRGPTGELFVGCPIFADINAEDAAAAGAEIVTGQEAERLIDWILIELSAALQEATAAAEKQATGRH